MAWGMLNVLNVGLLEAWTHWPATSNYFWNAPEPARSQNNSQSKGELQRSLEGAGEVGALRYIHSCTEDLKDKSNQEVVQS